MSRDSRIKIRNIVWAILYGLACYKNDTNDRLCAFSDFWRHFRSPDHFRFIYNFQKIDNLGTWPIRIGNEAFTVTSRDLLFHHEFHKYEVECNPGVVVPANCTYTSAWSIVRMWPFSDSSPASNANWWVIGWKRTEKNCFPLVVPKILFAYFETTGLIYHKMFSNHFRQVQA